MIQETKINSNGCFEPTDMPMTQNLTYSSIEDHSEYLLSGNYITMDMQQVVFDQQQHPQEQQQQQIYVNQQHFVQIQEQQQPFFTGGSLQPPFVSYVGDDYSPGSNEPAKDEGMHELSNASDASTAEAEIAPTDEKYAYLGELNSDNLMQFSQQSVLQEMILKEQLHGKANMHLLPTFEEHDIGNYNFKLDIPQQQQKSKTSWTYSEESNKLYIRMNDIFTINAVYTAKMPVQQLRIRTFICYVKEVSEPILRCQNHISKDNEPLAAKRESLLRCENPNAEYCGTADGKSIKERYSVAVPLSYTGCATQDDKLVRQPIALKFTCQNSCVGRKETCIMFLLEGMNGEILSQRLLNVRICSCPKRDRNLDEKPTTTKRKADNDIFAADGKNRKLESPASESPPSIKDENSCSDYENVEKAFDVQRTASGGYRVVMEFSSKDMALSTIDYAYAKEAVNIASRCKDGGRSNYNFRKLKRLYQRCADL